MPVRGGKSAACSWKGAADGAGTRAIAAAMEAHRTPGTTSTAMRVRLPTMPLRLLASLDDMEGRDHRVVVETAEFGASNRVVTGLQRLEPIVVRGAWGHVDLEIKRDEPERMIDVEGAKDDLDRETRFERESTGRVERCEVPGRVVPPFRFIDVRDVEIPVPLVRVDLDEHIRILGNRVGRDERLKSGDSDDHEDDRRDDSPDRLEAAVPGLRVRRPLRVPFADPELQDGVEDEPPDGGLHMVTASASHRWRAKSSPRIVIAMRRSVCSVG